MEFGKLLVVEMVEMQKLKYAYPVQDGQQVENDVVYTREEIDNCFDKVRCIQYNQVQRYIGRLLFICCIEYIFAAMFKLVGD